MPKASQFQKPKNNKSMYPAGHVAKPPKDSKQPTRINDNNRIIHSGEPNSEDGQYKFQRIA